LKFSKAFCTQLSQTIPKPAIVQLFKDITTFYTNLANGKGKILEHGLLGKDELSHNVLSIKI
jgi:hypothetical protein